MRLLQTRRSRLATTRAAAVIVVLGIILAVVAAFAGRVEGVTAVDADTSPRLFFLDLRGRVLSAAPDGSDLQILVAELGTMPDGIAVDVENGHVYWSNMGNAKEEDGSIMRADLDGGNVTAIVPPGGTFTAKQLTLDARNRMLYWSDREGMRVQRVNLDGTGLETLVDIAPGASRPGVDPASWGVGVAVDVDRGYLYWTQKGGDNGGVGSIRRAGLEIPPGQTAANRQDIEILFSGLPEPIDLDLDLESRHIYWTDRGDAPRGNTVNRAPMDPSAGFDSANRTDAVVLVSGLEEAIGVSLDLERDRMFVTDLAGSLYTASLDGSNHRRLATGLGTLTGITVVELPESESEATSGS